MSIVVLYYGYYDNDTLRANLILQCEENIGLKENTQWNREWLKQLRREGGDLFELD